MSNPFAYLGSASFLEALQKLLPRGAAFPRNPASNQTGYVGALADIFADLQARASDLSEVESDPAQTLELLPEWELEYGLPDPCAGESPLLAERRAQLLARIAAKGVSSQADFVSFAATLGYAITINTFVPFQFGHAFGQSLAGQGWRFAWEVNAPSYTIEYFTLGSTAFGEPFADWSTTVLQCELNRIKPAHTVLIFRYS